MKLNASKFQVGSYVMNVRVVLSVFVGVLMCISAPAQANKLNYQEYEELFGEPVTRGATGTPMRMSEVPLDMDIITQEDIKRSAARDIPDLLRQVRGVSVRRVGNGWTDVSIRGYNQPMASRVLVLLNGRQVYEEDYGFVAWDLIPVQLSEIQQIEVVRGPNTALYGFNATSGVINIITKNPLYRSGATLTASAGLNDYQRGSFVAGGEVTEGVGLQASVGGYSTSEDMKTKGGIFNTIALDEPNTLVGRVDGEFQLSSNTQLGISGSSSKVDETINLYGDLYYPMDSSSDSVKVDLNSDTDYGMMGMRLYHTFSSKRADGIVPFYDVALTDMQVSNVFKLGTNHTMRMQAGYRHVTSDIYPISAAGDALKYDIPSLSSLWHWQINDTLSWTNALRYDHFIMDRTGPIVLGSATVDDYDRDTGDFSFNSGFVYNPTQLDTWRFTVARGVDLPSITELSVQLSGGGPSILGNPSLGIGTNYNVELQYERELPQYNMNAVAAVFYQYNNDMVTSRQLLAGGGSFNEYIDSRMAGFELGLDGNFADHWRWGASYSLSNINDEYRGVNLVQRYEDTNSDHMIKANLGYAYDKWTADSYLSYASAYYTQSTPDRVDDVWQLDINIGYQITEQWSAKFTVIGAIEPRWNETGTTTLLNERQVFFTTAYSF